MRTSPRHVLLILAASLFLLGSHPIEKLGTTGVGLQVAPTQPGEVVILAVLDRSPAQEVGLRPGDLILQIDGQPLRGTDFNQITQNLLRGEGGTRVTIVYQRPGVSGTFSVTAERRVLLVPPVVLPGVEMKE